MGVDLKSTAIDTSHALRTSERATQFIGRFQTAPHLKARKDSFLVFPISIVQVEWFRDRRLSAAPDSKFTAMILTGFDRGGEHLQRLLKEIGSSEVTGLERKR